MKVKEEDQNKNKSEQTKNQFSEESLKLMSAIALELKLFQLITLWKEGMVKITDHHASIGMQINHGALMLNHLNQNGANLNTHGAMLIQHARIPQRRYTLLILSMKVYLTGESAKEFMIASQRNKISKLLMIQQSMKAANLCRQQIKFQSKNLMKKSIHQSNQFTKAQRKSKTLSMWELHHQDILTTAISILCGKLLLQ